MGNSLAGRRALITGSTSGIGKATALLFAQEGARVVVTGRREVEGKGVAAEIREAGGEAHFCRADLAIESDVQRLLSETVQKYAGLDVVVNNAGLVPRNPDGTMADGPIHRTNSDYWERIWSVDLRSIFLVSKYAVPHLLSSENACIVNLSSVHGEVGAGMDVYSAIKGAVISLTRSMALSYAHRIRVNCISPGMVLVERTQQLWDENPEMREQFERGYLTRIGRPSDIAQMCVFLASTAGEYVTGADFRLDGGMSVHGWFPPSPTDATDLFQVRSDEGLASEKRPASDRHRD